MQGKIRQLAIVFACVFYFSPSFSCTRVLHIEDIATMTGRSMDWDINMQTQLRIYPRGMERTGKATMGTSIKWKSRYGSMVVASYQNITAEGMNEKGFTVHLLELPDSNYGKRQLSTPGLSASEWGQYYLDNFASVQEAMDALDSMPYQIESFYLQNEFVGLHLAIEDPMGNFAVIEYVNGKARHYAQKGNATLTNAPTYDWHLKNLKQYAGFGGNKPLPGTSSSMDRFVRASWYNHHMPTPTSIEQEVLAIFSIIRNTSVPFEPSKKDNFLEGGTLWLAVGDLTNRVYYYFSTLALNTVNISLDSFNLSEGSPALMLDIDANPELHGDIAQYFRPIP